MTTYRRHHLKAMAHIDYVRLMTVEEATVTCAVTADLIETAWEARGWVVLRWSEEVVA